MNIKQVSIFCFLIIIGSIQMFGDLIGSSEIKGLGLATHASPAPKVFTAHQGFETFSSRFFIHWIDLDGESKSMELTPQSYRGLSGPYNRKNAYGAVLSYGPILAANPSTRLMFEEVSHFAFCGQSNLQEELNIKNRDFEHPIIVELKPRDSASSSENWQLSYRVNCNSITEKMELEKI